MGFYNRYNGYGRGEAILNLDPMSGLPVASAPSSSLATMMQAGMSTAVPLTQARDLQFKTPIRQMAISHLDFQGEYELSLTEKIKAVLERPLVGPVVLWHALAAAGVAGIGVYAYRRSKR